MIASLLMTGFAALPLLLNGRASVTAQSSGVVVDVQGPSPGAASCVIVAPAINAPGTWTSRPLTESRWTCGRDEMLQCNADGFEPRDVSASACKGSRLSIRMRRGSPVRLTLQGSATLEWRSIGARDTQLLATRTVSAGEVLIAEPRVLRVHRPGRAPVSLTARPLARLVIPQGIEGGEIFGRVLGDRIRPERVHFTGPSQGSVYVDSDGLYASPALLPGTYQVEAEYRGGVRSESATVQVAPSQTSERFEIGTPDAGGVIVSATDGLCTAGNSFDLTRSVKDGNRVRLKRSASGFVTDLGCDAIIEGLPPGRHQFVIFGPGKYAAMHDRRAARDFTVVPGNRVPLVMGLGPYRLSGTVTMGNRPATGLTLQLSTLDESMIKATGVTNERGQYSISAPTAGEYQLAVMGGTLMSVMRTGVRLSEQDSHFDWALPDSLLTVEVAIPQNARSKRLLTIHLRGSNGWHEFGYMTPDETVVQFAGIPDDHYEVTAVSDTAVATSPVQVKINAQNRKATVVVKLEPMTAGLVRVTDPQGSPIINSQVRVGVMGLDRTGSGIFRNDGVLAPGQMMTVAAPGFVPRCLIVSREMLPDTHVTLFPASRQSARLRFAPPLEPWERPGLIHGLPGSDCPVGLEFFTTISRKSGNDATVVELGDLPEGTFGYAPSVRWPPQPLQVPGAVLEFTRRPRTPQ
jgi:hypothetical protein